jgi:pimeloyl-ACP methyl ester carboxylesterase
LFAYPRNDQAAEALRRSADQPRGPGLIEQVRHLHVPVRVLHGGDDPLLVECAEDLARTVPNVALVVVEDVGHNPWMENCTAVRAALRGFLARLHPGDCKARGDRRLRAPRSVR